MRMLYFSDQKSSLKKQLELVSFQRHELKSIFQIYGQMVAQGKWKDYGISCMADRAIFSIFLRTAESPLFLISKCPAMSKKNGLYSIIGRDGQILKRGQNLDLTLIIFNKKLLQCV